MDTLTAVFKVFRVPFVFLYKNCKLSDTGTVALRNYNPSTYIVTHENWPPPSIKSACLHEAVWLPGVSCVVHFITTRHKNTRNPLTEILFTSTMSPPPFARLQFYKFPVPIPCTWIKRKTRYTAGSKRFLFGAAVKFYDRIQDFTGGESSARREQSTESATMKSDSRDKLSNFCIVRIN